MSPLFGASVKRELTVMHFGHIGIILLMSAHCAMCFGNRFCASMQKGCDMGWWVRGCGSPGDNTTGGCGPQVTTQQVGVVLGCERSWSAHLISRKKREGGMEGG